MGIDQIGKKGKQWLKDRAGLIKEAVLAGRIQLEDTRIVGKCEDCKEWKELDPDHLKKRSRGGSNESKNIDWVCRKCHNERDNMGDPKNKKTGSKKANWEVEHECIKCKRRGRSLICPNCGNISIK